MEIKIENTINKSGSANKPKRLTLPEGSETVHVINMCHYFPYNEYNHLEGAEIINREGTVLGNTYSFQIEIGPGMYRGKPLGGEGALLLKVNTRDITDKVSDALGAFNRWGSCCHMDVTNTASSLVAEILEERGYQVEEYDNGWPIMMMLISPINLDDFSEESLKVT